MTAAQVLLISPPWRLASWPSLALGTLKAYLKSAGIDAVCSHLHFDIAMRLGVERYGRISSGWELGEALYFSLYEPAEADSILARTADLLVEKRQHEMAGLCNSAVRAELEAVTLEMIEKLDLGRYSLIGMSVGALQLGASSYLARVAKQSNPGVKIVFGGSGVIGAAGARLIEVVPWIDVLVDGEGEMALTMLAREKQWSAELLARTPHVRFRDGNGDCVKSRVSHIVRMNATPPPDMDEYFEAAASIEVGSTELVMPVEASRGCAWEHRGNGDELRGCTFCGLYRGSPNFREKPMALVLAEIERAASRHGALEISFTDAYLPPSYTKDLLREIASRDVDITLFCEMRCDLDQETACLLAQAGARQVQLGVEAFNSRILKKISKGTRMIDNIYSIKLCEEYGVPLQYNLISRFPGVTADELDETLDVLPLLYGYTAPTIADFYLDRGSRIFANPESFGISRETFDRKPLPFLPDELARHAVCQVVPAEIALADEIEDRWEKLERAVAHWRSREKLAAAQGVAHRLSYRDAGSELIVSDFRDEQPLVLKLGGLLRELLLACAHIATRQNLLELVPGRDEGVLNEALKILRQHRLIAEERRSVLGLPVRAKLPSGPSRSMTFERMAAR